MFSFLGLGRFRGVSEHNLLIPLFKNDFSNYAYTHELDQDFKILRFKTIDVKYFDFIPFEHEILVDREFKGLICLEYSADRFFVGNVDQLKLWYSNNSTLIEAESILRPIMIDITSDKQVDKFNAWRKYLTGRFEGAGNLTEAVEAKYAEVQNRNLLWREISEHPPAKIDENVQFLKNLPSWSTADISEWLIDGNNQLDFVWRLVWEYADKNRYQTDESRSIIESYLSHVIAEAPLSVFGDVRHLSRRIFEILNSSPGNEFFNMVVEFIATGTLLFKRSRIDTDKFKEYLHIINLHGGGVVSTLSVIFSMLSNAVSVSQTDLFIDSVALIEQRNLCTTLIYVRDNLYAFDRFDMEEVTILVNVYLFLIYEPERSTNRRSSRIMNEILVKCSLSTKMLRDYWKKDPFIDMQDLLDRVNIDKKSFNVV